METNVNKVQALKLDERALVNAFEVEELEKRYEMGWIKSLDFEAEMDTNFKGENTCKFGCKAKIF